jgi:hypothetical protein
VRDDRKPNASPAQAELAGVFPVFAGVVIGDLSWWRCVEWPKWRPESGLLQESRAPVLATVTRTTSTTAPRLFNAALGGRWSVADLGVLQ